jgi:hypothetical protein
MGARRWPPLIAFAVGQAFQPDLRCEITSAGLLSQPAMSDRWDETGRDQNCEIDPLASSHQIVVTRCKRV